MKIYRASFDITTKIITFIVFSLIFWEILATALQGAWQVGIPISIAFSLFIIGTYAYSIKAYQILDESLLIKRAFSKFDKAIPLAEIESVSIPNEADFKYTVRTFGNGGLFGYYGLYANKTLGSFRMYATNKANRILIILKDGKGKIVLSPDDTGMVDDLRKHLKKQA